MKLLQKLINKFNGLHYPKEYLCLSPGSFTQPLHAYLSDKGRATVDITHLHTFAGYQPLILALPSHIVTENAQPVIIFTEHALQPNDHFAKKDAIAWLRMQKIETPGFHCPSMSFYEGSEGGHRSCHRDIRRDRCQ